MHGNSSYEVVITNVQPEVVRGRCRRPPPGTCFVERRKKLPRTNNSVEGRHRRLHPALNATTQPLEVPQSPEE